jgi:hypothetical protein
VARVGAKDCVIVALCTAGCAGYAVDSADGGPAASDGRAPGGADSGGDESGEPGVIEIEWTWTGAEYWNVDQALRIDQKGAPARWATHWSWSDAPGVDAGWIGIETDVDRLDGSHGDTAVFVLDGASVVTGPSCAAVGSATRCELPVAIDPETYYRLRIWTLGGDGRWGAWFMDHLTAEETPIATLEVDPGHTRVDHPLDRIELLGADPSCVLAPMAIGYLVRAGANQTAPGEYENVSIFKGDALTSGCPGAVVEPFEAGPEQGVVVSYGVP